MEKIIYFLFGYKEQKTYPFKPGVTTIFPDYIPDEEQWLNEFRVSFMHGWRSNPVYLD